MRRKDVLDLDDFSGQELTEVLDTAVAMAEVLRRPIKRVPPLRGKTIVNCFYEVHTLPGIAPRQKLCAIKVGQLYS